MIQTKEKEIGDHQVMVIQYPGLLALTNKARILNFLGSGIGDLLSGAVGNLTEEQEAALLSSAVGKIFTTTSPEKFSSFVLDLLKSTRIDGVEITKEVFDMTFAGDLPLMYKVLWFTLEVNYGNFFGAGGLGGILKKKLVGARSPKEKK